MHHIVRSSVQSINNIYIICITLVMALIQDLLMRRHGICVCVSTTLERKTVGSQLICLVCLSVY